MAVDIAKINEQALVSVLAAAEDLGLNIGKVYERACELTEQEGSKVLFLDPRDTGEVALAISLATARVSGLVK